MIWRNIIIDNIKTKYKISEKGDIVIADSGKYKKSFKTYNGYEKICLHYGEKKNKRNFFVHRLVGMMFLDGYRSDLTINHKDGNKTNNHYTNLEWISQEENERHAVENGLKARGERHSQNIYPEEKIHQVCTLLEKGYHYFEIEKITQVSIIVIYDIKNKKSWCHVSDKYNIPTYKLTKYSKYYKYIICEFEKGNTASKIANALNMHDKNFIAMINRLKNIYNNNNKRKVQRLSKAIDVS